jgi:DUF971 family protein
MLRRMSAAPLTPTRFDYDDAARALVIEWSDGAVHRIPFTVLRQACPCAVCLGEMGRPGRFAGKPELDPGEDELADISLVGLYGLNTVWGDGHSTGIYTFETLRDLGEMPAG